MELKQWTGVGHSTISEYVTVAFGGRIRDSLHPSAQVRNYHRFLLDMHPAFTDGGVGLAARAYLHNAEFDHTSPIWGASVGPLTDTNPVLAGPRPTPLPTSWTRSLLCR